MPVLQVLRHFTMVALISAAGYNCEGASAFGCGERRNALVNPHRPWWLADGPIRRVRVVDEHDPHGASVVDMISVSFMKANKGNLSEQETWKLLQLLTPHLTLMFRYCQPADQLIVYDLNSKLLTRAADFCIGRGYRGTSTEQMWRRLFVDSSWEDKWIAPDSTTCTRRVICTARTNDGYEDHFKRRSLTMGRLGGLILVEIVRTPFGHYILILYGVQVGLSGASTYGKIIECPSDFIELPKRSDCRTAAQRRRRGICMIHIRREWLRRIQIALHSLQNSNGVLLSAQSLLEGVSPPTSSSVQPLPIWPLGAVVASPQACDVVSLATVCVEVLQGNPLCILGTEANKAARQSGLLPSLDEFERGRGLRWPLAAESRRLHGQQNSNEQLEHVPVDAWKDYVSAGCDLPSKEQLTEWKAVNDKILLKRANKELK